MFVVEQANSVILKGSADFFFPMMNVLSVPVPVINWIQKRAKLGFPVILKKRKIRISKMPDIFINFKISLR